MAPSHRKAPSASGTTESAHAAPGAGTTPPSGLPPDHGPTPVWRNPLVTDPLVGGLVGAVFLHPLSMALIAGPPSLHEAMHAVGEPMSIYFALLGICAGLVSGSLRARLQRNYEELRKSSASLEQALTERESLLRILTHDMTNALLSASAALGVLRRRWQTMDAKDIDEMLGEAGETLAGADELIDFARSILAIQSGKLAMPLSPHALLPMVQDSLRLFRDRSADKGVALELEHRGNPVCLVEPVIWRNSVVNNLLSNAVKFSYPGSTVRVRLMAEDGACRLEVRNVGPCIATTRFADLFSACVQTTTPGTAGEEGTGFGLPLVSQFVDKMHGRVEVNSRPLAEVPAAERMVLPDAGEFSDACLNTFSVILPLTRQRPVPAESADNDSSAA